MEAGAGLWKLTSFPRVVAMVVLGGINVTLSIADDP